MLAGKTALVTGSTSGIGLAVARALAKAGAKVMLNGSRPAADAEVLRAELAAEAGGEVGYTAANLADPASARGLVEATIAAFGSVDILINNAGVVTGKPLLEASENQIRRTFEVNTLAGFWTSRALLPGMLTRDRGMIVTIASAAGLVGVAKQTDYSASKWGAVGFTESLRAELRSQGSRVRTLVVAPYYISTGMFEGVTTRFPLLLPIMEPAAVARKVLNAIESGRQQLVLPPMVRLVPPLRILPPVAFDLVLDLFGINHTMDGFIGRR